MKRGMVLWLSGLFFLLAVLGVYADPPPEFDYQGKILVDDVPLTGPGYFKYAISDETGATNFWAHDGTTTGEPATFITNDCHNGVFSAIIGGAPMGDVDPAIFALNTSLYLRVWFSADGVTFNEMLPAQDLLSSPYAINADMLDGLHAADILAGYAETDPVFSISPAFGITAVQIGRWNAAWGWGDHALAGYLTSEADPVWTAASNSYYQKTEADGRFVDVTGDTMTGTLTINSGAGSDLVVSSAGGDILIGSAAAGDQGGVAVGAGAQASLAGVAVGSNAVAITHGVAVGLNASGGLSGTAAGAGANGGSGGAAVGYAANGSSSGAAVGYTANGFLNGSAVGYQADGSTSGAAVGYNSVGFSYGAAMGYGAKAGWYGAALGRSANGATNGVAVGYGANGAFTNVAIGVAASAQQGTERIAIGHNVTNDVNESARLRGSLYLDGGTYVYGRRTFATGSFQQLLPLPSLQNVVYVATNGTSAGPGTIDRPFDTPQNAYAYAALTYVGQAAAVVIAAGRYPPLNMNAGNVHVIGESRCEITNLMISAAANSIQGKQRVENIIVLQATIVAADLGEDVKFHNCRFELGLDIYGPNVEVQDCFAMAQDAQAVIVGDGINNIDGVALTQSSFQNDSGVYGTMEVNQGVGNFEVIGCQIVNKSTFACIVDNETGPISPVHFYTHNYIRGNPAGTSVRDPAAGGAGAGSTMAFTHNTVLGGVGVAGHSQFYANNVVYGLINQVGGIGPGWTQAGTGTGADAANNTEHQTTRPALPAAWVD